MGAAAYRGKGFKERARVSGEMPRDAPSFGQQYIQASCQTPFPLVLFCCHSCHCHFCPYVTYTKKEKHLFPQATYACLHGTLSLCIVALSCRLPMSCTPSLHHADMDIM